MLADPRVSADTAKPGFPGLTPTAPPRSAGNIEFMDPPEHGRLRRMILPEFTFRRIEQLRPAIRTICEELVDRLKAAPAPADLVESFALPLPTRVICELLGVPYDIWDSSNSNEIMLWLHQTGPIGPIGSFVTNVSVGGFDWNVYKGWNGSNNVYSFLNTGYSTSGSVDILSVLRWLENSEHWIGDITLGNVQFGWEMTSSSGGMNFQVDSYWVSYG